MNDASHRRRPKPKKSQGRQIPNWLFYLVTLTILALWGAGIVLSFVSRSFEMPVSLNAAMPIVLVGVYGAKAVSDHRSDDDE